jgi:YVTN family beta-propeller protein
MRWRVSDRIRMIAMSAVAWCAGLLITACGADQPRPDAPAPAAETAKLAPVAIQGPYAVYVTNEVSGDLSVIDPATHRTVATLPLGKRPRGIRVAPDHARLYIALSGSPISPPGTDGPSLPHPTELRTASAW